MDKKTVRSKSIKSTTVPKAVLYTVEQLKCWSRATCYTEKKGQKREKWEPDRGEQKSYSCCTTAMTLASRIGPAAVYDAVGQVELRKPEGSA